MKYQELLATLFLFSLVSCATKPSLITPTIQTNNLPTLSATKSASPTSTLPVVTSPEGLIYCTDYCTSWWRINESGNPEKIASIPSDDGAVLSHNKQSLLYYANGDIWILNLQTKESHNTTNSGFDAAWSPDDTKIAFIGRDTTHQNIWIANLATGEKHNLTDSTQWIERGFCCDSDIFERILWSPFAPNSIFFASETPKTPIAGAILPAGSGSDLLPTKVNIDGRNYQMLDDTNGTFFSPNLSPDGRYLAYDGGGQSTIGGFIYDLKTNQRIHLLASDYGIIDPPNLRLVSPRWSPDGKKILWMAGNLDDSGFTAYIILFDIDKHIAKILGVYKPTVYNLGVNALPGVFWPAGNNFYWSPDGKWIVVAIDTWDLHESEPNYGSRIQVFDNNGTLAKEFYGSNFFVKPVWSPDNQSFAFNYLEYNNEIQYRYDAIRILNVNTWQVKELNLPKFSSVIDWVP